MNALRIAFTTVLVAGLAVPALAAAPTTATTLARPADRAVMTDPAKPATGAVQKPATPLSSQAGKPAASVTQAPASSAPTPTPNPGVRTN